eukprot:COSAG06_NODE_152_length_21942_cov_4.593234_26_plen_104_part_00
MRTFIQPASTGLSRCRYSSTEHSIAGKAVQLQFPTQSSRLVSVCLDHSLPTGLLANGDGLHNVFHLQKLQGEHKIIFNTGVPSVEGIVQGEVVFSDEIHLQYE